MKKKKFHEWLIPFFFFSVGSEQGVSFEQACLPWSHCGKEGHGSNAEFLKCLQAVLLGASMCGNVTSRCFRWMLQHYKWITLPHNRILSLWARPARLQTHCSVPFDCGTGQSELVSWYRCERYQPWLRQSVFESAEIKTVPPECSTHSVSKFFFLPHPPLHTLFFFLSFNFSACLSACLHKKNFP